MGNLCSAPASTRRPASYSKAGNAGTLPQGRGADAVCDVPADCRYVFTGPMNGCCSVVVLWGKYLNDSDYQHMRGQHGSGGPAAIDFATLFAGVPTGGDTIVRVAYAPADHEYVYDVRVQEGMAPLGYTQRVGTLLSRNALFLRDGTMENVEDVDGDVPQHYKTKQAAAPNFKIVAMRI